MKKITYILGVWIAVSILTSSCSKLLDVKPVDAIDAATSLVEEQDFNTATVGCYSYLRETPLYGRQLIVYPELLGNNAHHPGHVTNLLTLSRNARGQHMSPWQRAYEAIAQINIVLDQLPNFKGTEKSRKGIRGQLLFLRALYYHIVGKVYSYEPGHTVSASRNRGTVPLHTKAVYSYTGSQNLGRATQAEFYAFLYSELEEAYTLLVEAEYYRAPFFASPAAVAALFSRVCLYNGDWENTVKWSTIAIESGVGRLSTNATYVADWRAASHPESLFEVEFRIDQNVGVNYAPRADFTNRVDLETTAPNGRGIGRVSDDLMALFSSEGDNDVRKQLIMKGLGTRSNDDQMTKFLSRGGTPNLDNIPVVRLSEMYLNRAEAYAQIDGEETAAIADLNLIRTRAGLANAVGLEGDALIDEILKQRRLELCFEGHNWFDYKRRGQNIVKPDGTTLNFTDYRILSRIPWRDVRAASLMRQNYNY